jgi:hypothetical protein
MSSRPRKHPIRIAVFSQKKGEFIFEMDKGKDTPEDHEFTEKINNMIVEHFLTNKKNIK